MIDLKRVLGGELARLLAGWRAADIATLLGTDRARLSDLRRGRVERVSLPRMIRFLHRLGWTVEVRFTRRREAVSPNGSVSRSAAVSP